MARRSLRVFRRSSSRQGCLADARAAACCKKVGYLGGYTPPAQVAGVTASKKEITVLLVVELACRGVVGEVPWQICVVRGNSSSTASARPRPAACCLLSCFP